MLRTQHCVKYVDLTFLFLYNRTICYKFASQISRGGAVVARWAHNPKVVRSGLAPATKFKSAKWLAFFFCFIGGGLS